jgi:acyl-CoA thioesterase
MPHQFDQECHLSQVADGRFRGHVVADWNIGDNPNGGYLVSISLKALKTLLPHPDPISVTTHYLRPGSPDEPCDIHVDVLRSGRTLSTARATLSQNGKERIEVLAAYADLSQSAGVEATSTMAPPHLPDPDACTPRTGDLQGLDLPITSRLDIRLDPDLAVPGASKTAEMAGWIRFTDGREPDTLALPLFADAFPPSPLSMLGKVGWVPTIELTVNLIARPSPGWIQAQFRTDSLAGGRMVESGALWDSSGTLVAQSRQLGLVVPTG